MTVNLCLAPLKGVTDSIFRNTIDEFYEGLDWAVAPFISTVVASRIKPKLLKDLWPHLNTGMPVVPQIMSKSAADFMVMATAMFDLGYTHVNWNLGCPYPMVAKKGRGSGMLPYPERIESFLERVVPAIPNKLSIKMRIGRHRPNEIFELIPILDRYPLKMLIIHPRTGEQLYNGLPNLQIFGQCLHLINHEVIYNGDIVSKADYVQLCKTFPRVDTWMIGRGAVQDPYLPAMIKGQANDDAQRQYRFYKFHNALFARYEKRLCGPSHLLNRMKCLWGYFQGAFVNGRRIGKMIKKAQDVAHFKSVVEAFFNAPQKWRSNISI